MPLQSVYEVGVGKTYSTFAAANAQLVTDAGSSPLPFPVTVKGYAGTYNEKITVPTTVVTTATNWLFYAANTGDTVIINGSGVYLSSFIIDGVHYIDISGFTFSGNTDVVVGNGGASDNINIHNNNFYGIADFNARSGSNTIKFYNNLMDGALGGGSSSHCIMAQGCLIYNNYIKNCQYGIEPAVVGLGVSGQATKAYNNIFYKVSYPVSGNSPSTNPCYVYNNIFASCTLGVCVNGNYAYIYNNTFYVSGSLGSAAAVYFTGSINHFSFVNNIAYCTAAMAVYFNSDYLADNLFTNNCYYIASSGKIFDDSKTGLTYQTIAAWNTLTGFEANSINSNPLFLTDGAKDQAKYYQIRMQGPCAGIGTDLSAVFTTDYEGNTRTTWDLGAYNKFLRSVLTRAVLTRAIA